MILKATTDPLWEGCGPRGNDRHLYHSFSIRVSERHCRAVRLGLLFDLGEFFFPPYGWCNQSSQNSGLTNRNLLFKILAAGVWGQGVSRTELPLKPWGRLLQASVLALMILCLWQHTSKPYSILLGGTRGQISPFYQDASHNGLGTPSTSVWPRP